jgi:protein-disulfide isomerase
VPASSATGSSKRASARRRIEEKRAVEAAARARAARRRRSLIGGITAAVAVLVAVVVVIAVQSARTSTSAAAAVPAHTIDNGTVIRVGQESASVTVDLYEDLQCPNCKAFEDDDAGDLAQLVSAGKVQLHYHLMAFLDSAANQNYSTRATNAAAAVLNSGGPAAFQRFHDLLYQNQPPETGPGLDDASLIRYATKAGASSGTVAAQIRDLSYGDWVKRSTDQASKDGVTQTPTVLVGGKPLTDLTPRALSLAVLAAAQG